MAKNSIPFLGWECRKQLANEYVKWLPELEFDWWITLNFNRPVALPGVRNQFGAWLARIDRQYLGHNWCRRGNERAFAVAVVEHPQTNVHIHALLTMPSTARAWRRPYQRESMKKHWQKLEPAGQCVEELIYARHGVARYMRK
jgi:hypothetical protein